MRLFAIVCLIISAGCFLLLIAGCGPAPVPAKLRTVLCIAPAQGMQVCQYTYDGDEQQGAAENKGESKL